MPFVGLHESRDAQYSSGDMKDRVFEPGMYGS